MKKESLKKSMEKTAYKVIKKPVHIHRMDLYLTDGSDY